MLKRILAALALAVIGLPAIVLGGLVLPIALVLFSGRLFIARASVASLAR